MELLVAKVICRYVSQDIGQELVHVKIGFCFELGSFRQTWLVGFSEDVTLES